MHTVIQHKGITAQSNEKLSQNQQTIMISITKQ